MQNQTFVQDVKTSIDTRLNAIFTSRKEYWLMFLLLAAFNGLHMWLYQTFERNSMLETNLRATITIHIIHILFLAGIITTIVAYFRQYLLKESLDELCSAARKIARGDFSVRIGLQQRKNEKKNYIEVLFDDFNTMTKELASLTEKLKALSVTDELTKLHNRRSFMEYFDMVWKQSHRLNLPITVLLIDIDFFKKYNDSMGHLEGDKALISVAQCLRNQVKRETDFVARFGGEEFVCLLPFINKEEALEFTKTIVQSVENMCISHPRNDISKYVTVSAGMASTVPDNNNSLTQLLDNADTALYTAKALGRNRAVMF